MKKHDPFRVAFRTDFFKIVVSLGKYRDFYLFFLTSNPPEGKGICIYSQRERERESGRAVCLLFAWTRCLHHERERERESERPALHMCADPFVRPSRQSTSLMSLDQLQWPQIQRVHGKRCESFSVVIFSCSQEAIVSFIFYHLVHEVCNIFQNAGNIRSHIFICSLDPGKREV